MKSRVQCVPATLSQRRRRRRFPERELLERLNRYESLLRQNNITFEPIHENNVEGRGVADADSDEDPVVDRGHLQGSLRGAKAGGDFATKYVLLSASTFYS